MKYIISIPALLFLISMYPINSFADEHPTKPRKALKATIEAYDVHEHCERLNMDEQMSYSFEADKPLNFNIHYHVGAAVTYPVKIDGTSAEEGILHPTVKQIYCLMWTNKNNTTVDMSYRFRVSKK